MELDLENELADRAYPILASLVTLRPIAFVTTLSPDGQINAAPFSFFNLLGADPGADPPILALAPGNRPDGTPKDTARNIRLTHEFVVNLVDESIAEAMNKCAASLPYGENELVHAGLHVIASSLVKPPRIAESPVSLECFEWGTLPFDFGWPNRDQSPGERQRNQWRAGRFSVGFTDNKRHGPLCRIPEQRAGRSMARAAA